MAWNLTNTYLHLQRAIADELGDRQDLMTPLSDSNLVLSPIQRAIQSAIAKWEREPFYFNEAYDDPFFTTAQNQEFYGPTTSPVAVDFSSVPYISKVRVLVNNNRYTLSPRTWEYIEDISVNPTVQSEFPIDYAFFDGTMRFYPITAAPIPVTIMNNERVGNLVEDTDTNAWTSEGFDLIRSEAKLILAQEVLFDDDLVTRMKTAIYGDLQSPYTRQQTHGYLYSLRAETTRRGAQGRIRPSHF